MTVYELIQKLSRYPATSEMNLTGDIMGEGHLEVLDLDTDTWEAVWHSSED